MDLNELLSCSLTVPEICPGMQNAALLDKSDPSSGKEYYLPAKFHGMNPFM